MAATVEIPRRQRALVDSCFEESLYDAGLGILGKLRGPDVRPNQCVLLWRVYTGSRIVSQHIRQLLYLALYPVASHKKKETPSVSDRKQRGLENTLPEMASPTQEDVNLALHTLHHFLHTNEARDLLCAIPSLEMPLDNDRDVTAGNPLAYHASTITQAKNCWELLSPGFIITDSLEVKKQCRLVGNNSWPVLEWMIRAFERDGAANGGPSPMLASQLPISGFGPKLVMDVPLDILVTIFEEPLEERKLAMGTSLLHSLISLTRTTPQLLSPDKLVSETERRLGTMSANGFSILFSILTDRGFKLAVACAYIVTQSRESTSQRYTIKAWKPPKLGAKGSRDHEGISTGRPKPNMYPPPTAERTMEILRLSARIEEDDDMDSMPRAAEQTMKHGLAKLQVLGAMDELGVVKGDKSWVDAVMGGRLEESIRVGFTIGDGSEKESMAAVQQTAATYVGHWRRCLSSD